MTLNEAFAALMTTMREIATWKGEGPLRTPWQDIVKSIGKDARDVIARVEATPIVDENKVKLDLIAEVYDKLFDTSETFEPFGVQMVYLLGAIAKDGKYQVPQDSWEDNEAFEFMELLKQVFEPGHAVFSYIVCSN